MSGYGRLPRKFGGGATTDGSKGPMSGHTVDAEPFLRRFRASRHGKNMLASDDPQLREDLVLCAELDRFDFAMAAARKEGWLVLTAVRAPT